MRSTHTPISKKSCAPYDEPWEPRRRIPYAFKLLFEYASGQLHLSPSRLNFEQIDAPLVVGFLNHLETNRKNGPNSRNVRLAAIKSFMHFMEYRLSCTFFSTMPFSQPEATLQKSASNR